jgi:hypothetical protein
MSDIERVLLNSLLDLEAAVHDRSTAKPKPDLSALIRRVGELTHQLPRSTDPTLLHYLHKRSYEKARLYLQGRDAENEVGACRHDGPGTAGDPTAQ